MQATKINAPDSHDRKSQYSQAFAIDGAKKLVFVSGQIPVTPDAHVPDAFADQARQTWANVVAQLRAADMTLDNLVKVTIFLSSRNHSAESTAIRKEVLGNREPALTVIICDIFDEDWLLEIEAIAAA